MCLSAKKHNKVSFGNGGLLAIYNIILVLEAPTRDKELYSFKDV